MKLRPPRMFSLRRFRRKPRTERTPYYLTDVTPELRAYVLQEHAAFLHTFGRDYADEDPQFWTANEAGLKPTPVESPTIGIWLEGLSTAMRRANHHPAHIYAMTSTRTVIFGCGDCHDMDDCPKCNFRSVPEGWTKAWEAATRDYEKWRADVVVPAAADGVFTKPRGG